ncbi:hypothetical protein GCM10023196_055440 [Actinoallomurus vinaceus]|uniref:HEXXH motif domain-containing protein n=1 Tax=Actinoallomurus vinaceus TaxID=1080074 RepID=A0ABP8UFX0_9ACTN
MKRLVLPQTVFDDLAAGRGGPQAGRLFVSAARGRHLVLLKAVADATPSETAKDAFRALARMHQAAPDRVDPVIRYPAVGAWALATLRAQNAGGAAQALPGGGDAQALHAGGDAQALPGGGDAQALGTGGDAQVLYGGGDAQALNGGGDAQALYGDADAQALYAGGGAHSDRMAALAAAAAVRAGLPYETTLATGHGGLLLPSLGRALVDGPECRIEVGPDGARVTGARRRVEIPADPGRNVAGWQGLRVITADHPAGTLRLLIDDLDPYRFVPGSTLAPRLSAWEITHWSTVIQDAWTILRTHHSEVAEEIRALLSVVAPLTPTGWPASGTSRTTPGCVALALPRDGLSLAATLVHEVQHAKLTGLFHLVDLVSLDSDRRYYAPWRQDPRPITGLLHGTYAHLGVAAFWRRQRHLHGGDAAHAEFVRWRDAAAETAQVIRDSAALTPLGHRFLDGMLATLQDLQHETVPDRATELAGLAAEEHRRRFERWTGRTPMDRPRPA